MAQASATLEREKQESTPAAGSEPPRAYRADLDGIRALAILSVVLYHATGSFAGSFAGSWMSGGFTGVDIFFVLSGYLIGGHIYGELGGGAFSFSRFYQRRAKRILPALFAVIVFTMAAGMVLLSPAEAASLARSAAAATVSVSNILFWGTTNYFAGKSGLDPMLMTWSLGVEEQFYAAIPLLMVLVARCRRSWMLPATVAACAGSFAFSWVMLGGHPMTVFYLLPSRAWELGVGVVLAVAELDRGRLLVNPRWSNWAGVAGLAMMATPIFLLRADIPFPGPAALPSVMGSALAIAAPASWVNRRLLSLAPLAFVGRISYSLYLWHWPLLAFLHIVYGGRLPAAAAWTAIAAAFAAAVLSYYFVEQPLRRSGRAGAGLLIRYAAACGLTAAACAAVWFSGGTARRFPALAKMEAASGELRSDPCLAGYGADTPNPSQTCRGTMEGNDAVALWGDSHAAALAPGLRIAAQAQGYGFAQLTKAACPPVMGATHFSPRIPRLGDECKRFNERALAWMLANGSIRIVILNADWGGYLYRDWQDGWLTADLADAHRTPAEDESHRLFSGSLTAAIDELQAAGKQVMVLEDVPAFDFDPMWRVRTRLVPARRVVAGWLGIDGDDPGFAAPSGEPHFAEASLLLEQTLAGLKGASLIDLKPALCDPANQCAYRAGEELLYNDSNHLTAAGAMRAVRELRLPPAD